MSARDQARAHLRRGARRPAHPAAPPTGGGELPDLFTTEEGTHAMRLAATTDALTIAVCAHFDADVAEAITRDTEMVAAAARWLADQVRRADQVDQLIEAVAGITPDSTLDWLVDDAESPAGWLYSQLNPS